MKTIVCYGDSNTWGFMPKEQKPDWTINRFDPDIRWTGLVKKILGNNYRIEEEGLNGRTTIFDDPLDTSRNGLKYIDVCMQTKMPIDLIVLMLGTNDVKEYLGVSAPIIANGIRILIERIKNCGCGPSGKTPEILVISPPVLGKNISKAWTGGEFGSGCLEKSVELGKLIEQVCEEQNTHFLDAASIISVSDLDCVHLDEHNHRKLGEAIAELILSILPAAENKEQNIQAF